MPDSEHEDAATLTDEEIEALSRPFQPISLSTYGEALLTKTHAFKVYFFIIVPFLRELK